MRTIRPTTRDGEISALVADKRALRGINGNDYYRISTVDYQSEVVPMARLSQSRLEELTKIIGDTDRAVLHSLDQCRYLMTGQIQRLHYYTSTTPTACKSATTRALNKLKMYGLIAPFKRRIGGIRAGSASYVWHLTEGGTRFLNIDNPSDDRKRFLEPSFSFMRHTLAIAECYVRIVECCRNNETLKLKKVQFEPDCWRRYIYSSKNISLNPDLFIITQSGEYEDRWFIEMDLSTESPSTVILKCERYHQYYRTSSEQKKNGVFPITLWLVPDLKRKQKLEERIKKEYEGKLKLFRVITMDELTDILIYGCDPETLC